MNMSDDKEPDERDQIGEKKEERVTDDIEWFKLGKLSSKKNIDNIEKYYDESNCMDMSDNRESDERDHMDKNYE